LSVQRGVLFVPCPCFTLFVLYQKNKNTTTPKQKFKKELPKAKTKSPKSKGKTSGVEHPALAFRLPLF